jgi:hypothetical protein
VIEWERMKVSLDKVFTRVFVLTGDAVRKIHEILSAVGDPRFSAECADGLERSFETVDELLAYENPERKEIKKLRVTAFSSTPGGSRALLSLSSKPWYNVHLSLEASEGMAETLNERLVDEVTGLRPWYALLARTDFTWLLLGIYAIVWGSLILPSRWPRVSQGSMWSGILIGVGVGLLPQVLGVVLNRVRARYYPTGTFALGHGATRHHNKETVRTVIIMGFVISIVAGLITALMIGGESSIPTVPSPLQ